MKQQGMGLIEFLISLAICTFALVAILSSQVQALHASKDAFSYHRAEQLSLDLFERIRANPKALEQYLAYYHGIASTAACDQRSCTAHELALYDLQQWRLAIDESQTELIDSKLCFERFLTGLNLRWAWAMSENEQTTCEQAQLNKDLVLLQE